MTLAEHDAQLKAEGRYEQVLAIQKNKRDEAARRAARYQIEMAPVVQALRDAGVPVDAVRADFIERSGAYHKALPVLLEHLKKPYPLEVLGTIAQALAVPAARIAWPVLVTEYKKWPPPGKGEGMGPKDGLANALVATVTQDTMDELIALAKDPSHGSNRVLLLRGIRRSRAPQAKQAIEELASDPQLAKEIASWKRKKVAD